MPWYHVKFPTVSGKPDEYICADSIEIIQEFLYNQYINSSSFAITKEDIKHIKYKKLQNKSFENIKTNVDNNIIVSKATNLTTGLVYHTNTTNEKNIFRMN